MNWLTFKEQPAPRKTKIWSVTSSTTGAHLGSVKWMNAWRQYCFYAEETVWNPDCLDELEEFLRVATETHRNALAEAKSE